MTLKEKAEFLSQISNIDWDKIIETRPLDGLVDYQGDSIYSQEWHDIKGWAKYATTRSRNSVLSTLKTALTSEADRFTDLEAELITVAYLHDRNRSKKDKVYFDSRLFLENYTRQRSMFA